MTGSEESGLDLILFVEKMYLFDSMCYLSIMNDSWIAVVNADGLCWLEAETEHSLVFARRRASLRNGECFWAVLKPEHARFIRTQLGERQWSVSLQWLQRLAISGGHIVRQPSEVPDWISEHVTIPDLHDRELVY